MKVAVLTVSDSAAAGEASDLSGPLLERLVSEAGGAVVLAGLVPDEREAISAFLVRAADDLGADLVLTSGGTGFAPRDVTPEATRAVVDRDVPGIAEAIRAAGLTKTPRAMLSRAVAGLRGRTLVVNLSGSPRAVAEQFAVLAPVLEHAVATARGQGPHPAEDADRRRRELDSGPRDR